MKLTPLEIRKREFDRSLRGYDPQEVEAFLDMIAEQWQDLKDEHRRLEKKVEELEGQMDHYRKVEEALQTALDQTRENAEQQIENAREKAETIVEKAKADARAMEQEAEQIVEKAEADAEDIKRQARAEREQLKADVQRLRARRTEAVAQLRAFLQSELEVLEDYATAQASSAPPSPQESAPSPSGPGAPPEGAPASDSPPKTEPPAMENALDDPAVEEGRSDEEAAEAEASPHAPSESDAEGHAPAERSPADTAMPDDDTFSDEAFHEGEPDAAVESTAEAPDDDLPERSGPTSDDIDPPEELDAADPDDTGSRSPSEVFTNDVASQAAPPSRPASARKRGGPYTTPSPGPEPSSSSDAASASDVSSPDSTAEDPEAHEPEPPQETDPETDTEARERTRPNNQSTSEEIEKIWNILDEMEE